MLSVMPFEACDVRSVQHRCRGVSEVVLPPHAGSEEQLGLLGVKQVTGG